MKEENYPTGAFVAFVLLSQNEWDIKKLINDCKADWNIEIPYDGNEEALVAVMGDVTLAVAIMPAPVPNQEAEHYAGANYMWKDAVEVTKSHKAHHGFCIGKGCQSIGTRETIYKSRFFMP